jgi:hypothetical protein
MYSKGEDQPLRLGVEPPFGSGPDAGLFVNVTVVLSLCAFSEQKISLFFVMQRNKM